MQLFIWGNAETNVTIIAASVPILRVLIREVRTTARRYYNGSRDNPTPHQSHGRSQNNTVVISSAAVYGQKRDDQSDKSIMSDAPKTASGRILQTSEVAIEYGRFDRESTRVRDGARVKRGEREERREKKPIPTLFVVMFERPQSVMEY